MALPSAAGGLAPAYARARRARRCPPISTSPPASPGGSPPPLRNCRALVARVRPDLIHSHFVSTTLVARLALGRRHPVPRVFQVARAAPPRAHALPRARSRHRRPARPLGRHVPLDVRGVPRARRPARADLPLVLRDRRARARRRTAGSVPARARRRGPSTPLVGMVAYVYAPRWILGQRRGIKGHEDFIDAIEPARGVAPRCARGDRRRRLERSRTLRAPAAGRRRRTCGDALTFTGHRDGRAVGVRRPRRRRASLALGELRRGRRIARRRLPDRGDDRRRSARRRRSTARPDGSCRRVIRRRLAAAIREALGDREEARRRAAAGRAHVRELFDVERTAREIAELYRRILGVRAGAAGRPARSRAGAAPAVHDAARRRDDAVDVQLQARARPAGGSLLLLASAPLLVLAAARDPRHAWDPGPLPAARAPDTGAGSSRSSSCAPCATPGRRATEPDGGASPARPPAPRHQPRRAAAALERGARRHVARRAAAAPARVPRPLHAGAGAPPRGAPGDHRPRAGERTKRALGWEREVRARRLVRRSPQPRPRLCASSGGRSACVRGRGVGAAGHATMPEFMGERRRDARA